MSFFVSGQPLTKFAKLSNNSATVLFTAQKRTTIVSIAAQETNGGTQTLALWRRDAADATTHSIRSTLAVSARQRVLVDEVITLNQGDTIRGQSGDASGYFDIFITYLAPDATIGGNHH